MASVLITTADAVVEELNNPTGHTWSRTFNAGRNFGDWKLPLEDSEDEVRVDVFPLASMPCESETRESLVYTPTIAVVVRYKFRQADADEDTGRPEAEIIDELIAFLEEINEHFAFLHLGDAAWDRSEVIPLAVEHLANPRQYTGMVRLTYLYSQGL
jgi:hypothetical protein